MLEAGRRALRRYGYGGTTLERIATEAGLSRVTLHRRGVSKQAILEALTERGVARFREALWPALTAVGPTSERMELALIALCEVTEEHLELLLALRAQTDSVFHDDGEIALTRTVFTEPLERLLYDGAIDGTLRAFEPRAGATLVFNSVGWTYVHLRTGHRWPPASARAAVVDLALEGLRVPRSAGSDTS